MRMIQSKPFLGSLPLGWQKGDRLLSRIGSEGLTDQAGDKNGPDLFVATTLSKEGGHTGLIGDFVRALFEISPGTSPHLIVTNCNHEHSKPLEPEIIDRVAIDAHKIDMLPGPALSDRLEQLFGRISQLKPRRLFLFHHPDDPVACAIARSEIFSEIFLIHHADSIPSFGLYLPGVRVVDVTPHAAALTHAQGLVSAMILLTAPDPGPRRVDFLQRGNLVTATCGSSRKFRSEHRYRYADTVGFLLHATGGWHVHVGPLEEVQLSEIRNAVAAQKVDIERFIHVPWTNSLPATLWENGCDLFFGSFPITGARADVEVFASATPHLAYTARLPGARFPDPLRPADGLRWNSWEELKDVLAKVSNQETLRGKSKLVRAAYERFHHPRVFVSTLKNILNGGHGIADPDCEGRAGWAMERLRECVSTDCDFSIGRLQEAVDRASES